MDEKDSTLYINCRNKHSVNAIYEFIKKLLEVQNIKYKEDTKYYVIETQIDNNYLVFIRIINLENDNMDFISEKYYLSDQDILDYIKKTKNDEDVYKYIMGNFLKGLN